MERDARTEVMLKYSEDRSHFGKGPNKPHRTGHCSNELCGDAVGVRVWLCTKQNNKYIRDIWWTGEGCTYCLGAAAAIAPRFLGELISNDNIAKIVRDTRSEFADLPEGAHLCMDTAILAFVRAISHQFYTKTDWTDGDLERSITPSEELDDYYGDRQRRSGFDEDDEDLYVW